MPRPIRKMHLSIWDGSQGIEVDVTVKNMDWGFDEVADELRDRLANALTNLPRINVKRGRVKVA